MGQQHIQTSKNARKRLMHNLSEFGAPRSDLVAKYSSYIRTILVGNAIVWNSSLTEENKEDWERVQKSAFKVIFKHQYQCNKEACLILNLDALKERRQQLWTSFEIESLKN